MRKHIFVLVAIIYIGLVPAYSQTDKIVFLSWSNDQSLLAIAKENHIEIFDVVNNLSLSSTDSAYGGTVTVVWSPDNQRIATNHSDYMIRVWDVNSGILLEEIIGYDLSLTLEWSLDNKLYSSTLESGTYIWDMDTYEIEGRLSFTAYDFSFSPDGRYLAIGAYSGSGIYDMLNGNEFGIQPYPELVHSLIWNSDGTKLAGIDILGNFGVWDLTTNQQETFFQMGRGVLMWWEENHLYTANDGTINVWDTTTWQIISSVPLELGFFVALNSTGSLYAEFSSNEIEIATYCEIIENGDISALTNAIVHGNSIMFNKQICLTENTTYTLTAPLPSIIGDITLIGNGAEIVMTGAGRIFEVAGTGGLTLKNITVSGGNAVQGGAIFNAGTLVLENVVLENNSATDGGAIYNTGSLTMRGGAIQNNTATNFGGGIYTVGDRLDVEGVNIRDNDAVEGSGVYQGE
jgi:predicted outer membrane repeat protein